MVHSGFLGKRGKNAPDLDDQRQAGEHSTNSARHLPEERFGFESKTEGTTRLYRVNQGVRLPGAEHVLLLLLG